METMDPESVPLTDEIAQRMGFVNLAALQWHREHQGADLLMEIANLRELVKQVAGRADHAYLMTAPIGGVHR